MSQIVIQDYAMQTVINRKAFQRQNPSPKRGMKISANLVLKA